MNSEPKKNFICCIFEWIYNNVIMLPIVLVSWCVLALIDSFVLLFSKNNAYHQYVRNYYQEKVKTYLTNRPFSRTSFSSTHGFLFSIVVVAAIFWVAFQFSPNPKIIKTKRITVTVTSETKDTIDFISMILRPDWSVNKDSLNHYLQFWFFSSYSHLSDTAKFNVKINTNFDAEFHPAYDDVNYDSICERKTWEYDLAFAKDDDLAQFVVKSNSPILNDPETPYVNLYIEFNRLPADNALMPLLTDSTLMESAFKERWEERIRDYEVGMFVKLGNTFEEGENSNASILPYDLISLKPEPTTNNPIYFDYNRPEKYLEVLDKGININVVNRNMEAQLERDAFLHSVLIGALISIVVTLILALLRRWREINEKEGKKDPFDYD